MQKEETQVIRNGRNGVKPEEIQLNDEGHGHGGGGAHHDEVNLNRYGKRENSTSQEIGEEKAIICLKNYDKAGFVLIV